MSIVSSYFSSRPPISSSNARHPAVMDSLLAIAAGLGLRFIIDLVSRQNHKVTGTLVGLWEGVVMQHFLKKTPKSYDPYVSYGVRLFIDFLIFESLSRLVLVLVWTGMGILLADIAPAIWVDAGLRRFWRRFRRDLYIIERSLPVLPLFPRARIVRFSPPRARSVVSTVAPTILTNAPSALPHRLGAPTPVLRKRPVPGAFPDTISETDTDTASLRSPLSESSTHGTTHFTFSLFHRRRAAVETASESSSFNDLDDGNISSSDSMGHSIGTSAANPAEIPDEEDADTEHERVVDKGKGRAESDDGSTPLQDPVMLPPTPSDSTFKHPERMPPAEEVPIIPDVDEGWENISRTEGMPAAEGRKKEKLEQSTPPDQEIPSTSSGSTPPHHVPPPVQHQQPTAATQESTTYSNLGTPWPTSDPPASSSLFNSDFTSTFGDDPSPSTRPPPTAGPPKRASSVFGFGEDNRAPPPSYHAEQGPLDGVEPDLKNILQYGADNQATSSGGAGSSDDLFTGGAGDGPDDGNNAAGGTDKGDSELQKTQQQPEERQSEPEPPEPEPVHSPDPPIESLQATENGRLDQVLELRKRATDVEQQIRLLTLQHQTDISPEIADKLGKLSRESGRLNKKADTWHNITYSGASPPMEIDLSNSVGAATTKQLKDVIVQCLLKNQPSLNVQLAMKKMGKVMKPAPQKATVVNVLNKLNFQFEDVGKMITIQLPVTPTHEASS